MITCSVTEQIIFEFDSWRICAPPGKGFRYRGPQPEKNARLTLHPLQVPGFDAGAPRAVGDAHREGRPPSKYRVGLGPRHQNMTSSAACRFRARSPYHVLGPQTQGECGSEQDSQSLHLLQVPGFDAGAPRAMGDAHREGQPPQNQVPLFRSHGKVQGSSRHI